MGSGEGSGGAGASGVLWFIIWILICIFVAYFVAGFFAFWYIILLPFTVCISGLKPLTDFLLSAIQFPRYCAQNAVDQKPLC